jgi:hypothetical protein
MYYEMRPFGVHVSLLEPGFINSSAYLQSVVGARSQQATDDENDPYHPHFTNMNRFIGRMMRFAHATPESVARRVTATINRSRPPLRLMVTWDARLLWWFRRFAPHTLNIWLTYRMLPGIRRWRGIAASTGGK